MVDYGALTPEEKKLALRNTPVVLNRIDSDTLELRRKNTQKQLELREEQERAYGRKIVEAQQAKELEERLSYERRSGGRWKLLTKPRQVLFSQKPCEYCDAPVVYPLSGWNPNVNIMGYTDLTISYNVDTIDDQNNYTRTHHCVTSDPILDKKIEALRNELKEYKEHALQFFKHQASL